MLTEDLTIFRTMDDGDFRNCALMMAATDPWVKLSMSYDICLKAFEGEYKEIYIAKYGNDLAGFVILQVCGTFSGYIQSICIDEKYRGKGFGTFIINFCENRILEFSPNVFICVSVFNTGAAKLYYKMGYRLVGELDSFLKEGFTELLLRKTVGPRLGYKSL
jgi:[ribosomal protein S18]-alanine N-acetyltransferase